MYSGNANLRNEQRSAQWRPNCRGVGEILSYGLKGVDVGGPRHPGDVEGHGGARPFRFAGM